MNLYTKKRTRSSFHLKSSYLVIFRVKLVVETMSSEELIHRYKEIQSGLELIEQVTTMSDVG